MGDVVGLPEKKEPTLQGTGHCIDCKHEWTAVVPVGTTNLECPKCGTMRGVWFGLVQPMVGKRVWSCGSCDCQVFVVVADENKKFQEIMCIGCGKEQVFG